MASMTNSQTIRCRVSKEIETVLREAAEAKGVSLSDFLRDAGLKEAKRRDLIGTMRGRGQPKKAEE